MTEVLIGDESHLAALVQLSREVGRPERDLVILAEGNTSLKTAADRMLVKATGATLANAQPSDFVEVDLTQYRAILGGHAIDDARLASSLLAAVTRGKKSPSVESLLHAVCLELDGVAAVIHSHPTAVNSLLCSTTPELLTKGSLFPDQVVVLGRHPMLVPYVDPGLPLARYVRTNLARHLDQYGEAPRAIFLANHGMFALGATSLDALQITEMAVKAARVILGSVALGGPRFLAEEQAERIDTRPDELLRRRVLLGDNHQYSPRSLPVQPQDQRMS